MILYKLTDQDGRAYGDTQWGPGVEHRASGEGELCGPGWLHAYLHPILALYLNPIHANFPKPRLWEAEGEIGKTDRGLKVGCTRLRTLREIPLPVVTIEHRVAFAIRCALGVYRDPSWVRWAQAWLTDQDRSANAAKAAEDEASAAGLEAARAAKGASREAAWASAEAVVWSWEAVRTAEAVGAGALDLASIAETTCGGWQT